jgi:hypothetical protein
MLPFALKTGGFLGCAGCWWKTRNNGGVVPFGVLAAFGTQAKADLFLKPTNLIHYQLFL